MPRQECKFCKSIQLYTRLDKKKVCRKCGEVQENKKEK